MTHKEKEKVAEKIQKAKEEMGFIFTKLEADVESIALKNVEFEKKDVQPLDIPF